MDYFVPHYDFWRVATSVLIASFASYVTLDLAKRVRADDHSLARIWWAAGSIAMGTGIWSMLLSACGPAACRWRSATRAA